MKHTIPTKKSPSKQLRTRFWVDPGVQIPYLLSILGSALLTCGAVGALFYLFLSYTHGIFVSAILKILPNAPHLAEEYLTLFTQLLLREKDIITWTYGVIFITIGCSACIAGIKLSHRYAGPIVNFRHTIRLIIQDNKYQAVHLRKADEMRDLMDTFNHVLHHIKLKEDTEHALLKNTHHLATTSLTHPNLSEHDKKLLKEIQDVTQDYAA